MGNASEQSFVFDGLKSLCALQISLILSIAQAATGSQSAGLYIMLGISLLGFVALEIIMVSLQSLLYKLK